MQVYRQTIKNPNVCIGIWRAFKKRQLLQFYDTRGKINEVANYQTSTQ